MEIDTSVTLSEQKPYRNHTPEKACEELFDTFHTLSGQNHDTFLHFVCEIYVKWTELPLLVRKAVAEWGSLPDQVRNCIEILLGEADESRI